MAFEAFDTAAIDAYAAEAKERWGGGEAYRQSAKRTAAYTAEDWNAVQEEMRAQFARFAALRGGDPAGEEAQAACEALRRFISCRFYDCTKEILAGLGAMYIEDERFRESIDRCGEGTAGSRGGHRDLLRDMKKAGRPFGAAGLVFSVALRRRRRSRAGRVLPLSWGKPRGWGWNRRPRCHP